MSDPEIQYAFWQCDRTYAHEARSLDYLPNGFEVCQRCAEAAAVDRLRRDELQDPDRNRFNQRTKMLLAEIGV